MIQKLTPEERAEQIFNRAKAQFKGNWVLEKDNQRVVIGAIAGAIQDAWQLGHDSAHVEQRYTDREQHLAEIAELKTEIATLKAGWT
jgi:hypothetical protein